MCAAREARRHAAVPAGRRARDRGAGVRDGDHSARRQDRRARATPTSRPRRRSCRATARSISSPGPSEIVVVSTAGRPAWIAADLIAQAEHDPDARAILHDARAEARARGAARDPAADAGRRTGARRRSPRTAGSSLTRTLDEAIALSQRMAPEHVVCDTDAVAARLTRAGTVFVGDYSAQASGDYVTGSNHVLPTSGAARARGGLSAADFVRVSDRAAAERAGAAADRAGRRRAGARRGAHRPRRVHRTSAALDARNDRELRDTNASLTPESRPAAAPEREHRRVFAGGDRRAAVADAPRRRDLSRLRGRQPGVRQPPGRRCRSRWC